MNTYKVTATIDDKPACYYVVKAETPGQARQEVLGYLPDGTAAAITVETTESDYLTRPMLDGLDFTIIHGEQIKIACPSTLFCNMRSVQEYKQPELLEQYKEVVQLAKEHGAKISRKNGYKNTIVELWNEYTADCAEARRLLDEATTQAETIRARGIHYGCSDDAELDKLHKIDWKRQELFYRNKAISRINSIFDTLQGMINDFRMCDENSRITAIYI